MKFEWEYLYKKEVFGEYVDATVRAKVPGGWLVKHSTISTYQQISAYTEGKFGYAANDTMVFVADRDHQWTINEDDGVKCQSVDALDIMVRTANVLKAENKLKK